MPASRLPSFIKHYLHYFIIVLVTLVVATLGVLTFGDGRVFDWLSITSLVMMGFYLRDDRNLLTIVILLTVGRLLDQAVLLLLDFQLLAKLLIYPLVLAVCWFVRYDISGKICMGVTVLCISITAYWYQTDYAQPQLHWYLFQMAEALLTMHFLFLRKEYFSPYFNHITRLPLDSYLYDIYAALVVVNIIMLTEYLLRHLFFPDLLLAYDAYSYVVQVLSCTILWLCIAYFIKKLDKFSA